LVSDTSRGHSSRWGTNQKQFILYQDLTRNAAILYYTWRQNTKKIMAEAQ